MSTTAGPPAPMSAVATEKPSPSGKLHVEQHRVGRFGGDRRKRSRGVGRLAGNDEPAALEELPRDRPKRLMVVDDQHPLRHVAIVAHGSRNTTSGFSLEFARSRWKNPFGGGMINRVNAATRPARDSSQRRFRIAIIAASVVAALAGSVLLATRDSGEKATTRGITATLPVPGTPARSPSAEMRSGSR